MKKIIKTSNAPKPIGPYNQAVISGNLMFMSGQIAFDPSTGELVTEEIQAETKQVMENLIVIMLLVILESILNNYKILFFGIISLDQNMIHLFGIMQKHLLLKMKNLICF